MIRFKENGMPDKVNSVCAQCRSDCKQHKDVQLIRCPFFEAIKKSKPEKEG